MNIYENFITFEKCHKPKETHGPDPCLLAQKYALYVFR